MNKNDKWNLELSEYIKQGEPTQVEKTEIWETAIGLQDVDGLKPSNYLVLNALQSKRLPTSTLKPHSSKLVKLS